MKCLILGITDKGGGGGRAQYRLFKGLLGINVDANLLVKHATKIESHIYVTKKKLFEYFRERFESVILRYNRTELSNTIFSLGLIGNDISNHPLIKDADIINIHWINSYLSIDNISNIIETGKPVVFTLHDMWSFTGGCHYNASCNKYETECSNCPQLKEDKFNLINAIFKKKLNAFNNPNVTVITPSNWLSLCSKKSRIFNNIEVKVIPNSLETDIFYPKSKNESKEKIGIDKDKITILFGTSYHNEKRKGFRELLIALEYCKKNDSFNEYLKNKKIVVIIFGNPSRELVELDIPIKSFGFIDDDELLATVYSASDFLVLPSLEDNLPNIMIESLACGTPVVAFDIGGIPDVVKNGFNGFLSPVENLDLLGDNIIKLVTDEKTRKELQNNSHKDLDKMFSLKTQATNYRNLFEELIKNNKKEKVTKNEKYIEDKKPYIMLYLNIFPKSVVKFLIKFVTKIIFRK